MRFSVPFSCGWCGIVVVFAVPWCVSNMPTLVSRYSFVLSEFNCVVGCPVWFSIFGSVSVIRFGTCNSDSIGMLIANHLKRTINASIL